MRREVMRPYRRTLIAAVLVVVTVVSGAMMVAVTGEQRPERRLTGADIASMKEREMIVCFGPGTGQFSPLTEQELPRLVKRLPGPLPRPPSPPWDQTGG